MSQEQLKIGKDGMTESIGASIKTTTKEATHTPTPWKVQFFEETAGKDAGNFVAEIHTDGVSICKTVNTPTHHQEWIQESDANMAFIVRAVNSFDDRDSFLHSVARSACLDQKIGNKCICFSCEAQRLLNKVAGL